MRFKLDENVPISVKGAFLEAGHEASDVYEEGLAGTPDETIAAACRTKEMLLVTLDQDFANIVTYPPSTHPGIVVLRLPRLDAKAVETAVREFVSSADMEQLRGTITIVEPRRMRVRR